MTTKTRKRPTKRPLRLKRPRRPPGTQTAAASRAAPLMAAAAPRAPTPTIELETAFADDSLEMDESDQKFRVSLALQEKIAAAPTSGEWPPRGSHPDNEEWETTVNALPAGWGVYVADQMIWDSTGVMNLATDVPTFGNVDPDLVVDDAGPSSAGGIRIDVNSARKSHIFWQDSKGSQPGWGPALGRFGLFKKFSVPVGTDASFLISWGESPPQGAVMFGLSGSLQFVLCEDAGGKPSLTRKIMVVFARVPSSGTGSRYFIKTHAGGGSVGTQLYEAQPNERHLVPLYPFAMLIKRNTNWYLRLYDLDGSFRNFERVADLGASNLVPAWWGICCPSHNTGASGGAVAASPYMSSNFLRRWDSALKIL